MKAWREGVFNKELQDADIKQSYNTQGLLVVFMINGFNGIL